MSRILFWHVIDKPVDCNFLEVTIPDTVVGIVFRIIGDGFDPDIKYLSTFYGQPGLTSFDNPGDVAPLPCPFPEGELNARNTESFDVLDEFGIFKGDFRLFSPRLIEIPELFGTEQLWGSVSRPSTETGPITFIIDFTVNCVIDGVNAVFPDNLPPVIGDIEISLEIPTRNFTANEENGNLVIRNSITDEIIYTFFSPISWKIVCKRRITSDDGNNGGSS